MRARGIHLDAIKHIIFQTTQISSANPEWCVLTVFSVAPCSFDLQTTVACYNFKLDKDPSTLLPELAFTVVTWYTNRCILFYISTPNNLFLILSFHSLTLVLYICSMVCLFSNTFRPQSFFWMEKYFIKIIFEREIIW